MAQNKSALSKRKPSVVTGIERYLAENDVRVSPNMNVYEASKEILDNKASGATVVDASGALVGVLSELDCLRAMVTSVYNGSDPGGALVSEIMTTQVETAQADTDMITVAKSMLETKHRRRPVIKDGKLIGQISCRQILRAVTEDLKND
ncbi:MAG: CBS domain-containing protein [Candidatus Azotimanducaceae bacterium]|jgi:CBS domain-containing protein